MLRECIIHTTSIGEGGDLRRNWEIVARLSRGTWRRRPARGGRGQFTEWSSTAVGELLCSNWRSCCCCSGERRAAQAGANSATAPRCPPPPSLEINYRLSLGNARGWCDGVGDWLRRSYGDLKGSSPVNRQRASNMDVIRDMFRNPRTNIPDRQCPRQFVVQRAHYTMTEWEFFCRDRCFNALYREVESPEQEQCL